MTKEFIKQDYYYTFVCDVLEMVMDTFLVIQSDETLYKLYTAVMDYLYSKLPDYDGTVIDYNIVVTVEKK